MTERTAEYETLLRDAIKKAKDAAPHAVEDLVECASTAAEAVASVTGGRASLELVPIEGSDFARLVYQLQLRKAGSEAPPSDLGIYQVATGGYSVLKWYSRAKWKDKPSTPEGDPLVSRSDLDGHFKWLLSNPESRLVGLITFIQRLPQAESKAGQRKKGKR